MDSFSNEDLESLIVEMRWNNKEALRLFQNERSYLNSSRKFQVLNSNASRDNVGWIDTHLSNIESKFDDLGENFAKWRLVREALEKVSTDSVLMKSSLFEEKRRTASLYNALDESVSVQQNQESQIKDLKAKLSNLQRQQGEYQQKKLDNEKELSEMNITLTGLLTERREETIRKSKALAQAGDQIVKRPKLKDRGSDDISSPAMGDTDEKNSSSMVKTKNEHNKLGRFISPNVSSSSAAASSAKNKNQNIDPISDKDRMDASIEALVGRRIQREFPSLGYFQGVVQEYRKPYFLVVYDDGDTEDMNQTEVRRWLCPS